MFGFLATLVIGGFSDVKIPIWVSLFYFLISFGAFLAGWFYDNLLLKLNPESNILILQR
ncbi:hypothetical protein [Azospirillum largimobile]